MKKLLLSAGVAMSLVASAQTTVTFSATGSMQTFTVPSCVSTVTITCNGARGQYSHNSFGGGTPGMGGSATGTLAVTPGQVLNIFVGDTNGYNGGGAGGMNGNTVFSGSPIGLGAYGGGASDVRFGGTALTDRIIVAGGGGGAGNTGTWPGCQYAGPSGNGGNGGGTIGSNGTFGVGNPCNCGGGGGDGGAGGNVAAGGVHGNYYGNTACLRSTWTAGQDGTLGQGGAGSTTYHNGTGGGGGGGGGYYGGGSGGNGSDTTPGGGGGGGSSYTGGVTSGTTVAGTTNGNGSVTITYSISSALPSAPTTFSGTTVCPGAATSYTVGAVAGATSYTWTVPSGWSITSGQGTTTVNITVGASSDTVWCYATNACGDGPAGYIVASVYTLPAINLGADTASCSSVTLTADPASTYIWCSGQTTQSITATMSGAYCVVITDANGCSNSDTVNVTINTPPTVVASAAMNFVCVADDTVQLFGSPSGGTFTGPGVIPGDQFVPATAGVGTWDVVYSYTDPNGCSGMDTTTIIVDICTGVSLNSQTVYSIQPNPAAGSCQLTFANDLSNVRIEVRDVQGRLVKSQNENAVHTGTPVEVKLDGVAAGTYLLHVISDGHDSVQKLQVQ